jgi:hypothetical protein
VLQPYCCCCCWLQVSGPTPKLSWALVLIQRLVSQLPPDAVVTLASPSAFEGALGDQMLAAGSSPGSGISSSAAMQEPQQQQQTGSPAAGQQMVALPACIAAVLGVPLEQMQRMAAGDTFGEPVAPGVTHTAAAGAAAAAANSKVHAPAVQVPGGSVVATIGGVTSLLPQQVMRQLSADLETASSLLQVRQPLPPFCSCCMRHMCSL